MIVLTKENAARVIKSYGGVEISPVSSPDRGLVLGIYGPGGVGKTTLAATITDAADELGSPALLLNARGNPHVIASYARQDRHC
jgi:ABC-type branched-subunit amino acid transport system ATPase component